MPRKTKMNDLTSPELVSQINPNNARLRDDFLDYLRSVQRSPGTIGGYQNDLNILFVFCLQRLGNKDFQNITKRDLVTFQNWLINENGNSPARVRRIKSAISSLSNYIEGILDDEPEFENFRSIVRKIESPVNQPVREKTVLSNEQLEELLQTLTDKGAFDKACMLALAMYSGRRKSELVRFKVDDFKESNLVCDGALYKTSETMKTKGFGLGKYIYCYTLAKNFKPYLDRWLKYRQENNIESKWLFPMREDLEKQMKPETLNSWAMTFSNMLGEDFYWHAMRHAFTTNLVRAGIPDSVIKEIVGWSDVGMVSVYTDIDAEEQIGMYFKGGDIHVPDKKDISDL